LLDFLNTLIRGSLTSPVEQVWSVLLLQLYTLFSRAQTHLREPVHFPFQSQSSIYKGHLYSGQLLI